MKESGRAGRRRRASHPATKGVRARRTDTAGETPDLLLLQDKKLPSVVGMVTGEAVSGSWWSHPRAHEIFRKLEELDDVISAKLIAGKVTYVSRKLWPAIAASAGPATDGKCTASRLRRDACSRGSIAKAPFVRADRRPRNCRNVCS